MIKKIIFISMIAGMSLAVLAVAAELMLRIQERRQMTRLEESEDKSVLPSDIPGLNYTLAPGPFKDDIIFNSHGFNMPERERARQGEALRVMFVGDSVTQGVGTHDTAEAYPNRVQAVLDEQSGTDRFDVWNCGTGGYNARQVLIQMQHILPPYDPDVIVYGFNFNDYWPPYQFFHGQPALPPEQNAATSNEGFLDALKSFRVVLKLRDLYNDLAYRVRGYSPVYVDRKTGYPSWHRMKTVIEEMRDYCMTNDIGFVVVVHPNEQFLYRKDAKNIAHQDVLSFLDNADIPYFDLLPLLRPHRKEDLFLRDGNHMTAHGYDRAANLVAEWILDRGDLFPAQETRP